MKAFTLIHNKLKMKIHYFYRREYNKGFYNLELVAWLEEMHARVMQAEQAALAVMGDMPAYTARMQEKARLLASLEEEGEAYLEELPEQLQDQAGHRLHRFSASARNALRIGSIFYMSALLYPEDHKPGQPDDLQVFIRRLRDEGEHYTLHPQD